MCVIYFKGQEVTGMWQTFAFMALMTVGQQVATPPLEFLNIRAPMGIYGANRPDSKKYHPGDNFILAFDINGLKVDAIGQAFYSLAGELFDKDGKSIIKTSPKETAAFNPLGGARLPAYAAVPINLEMPAGTYTYKLTLTDLTDKRTILLTQSFEVLPKSLGFVLWHMTYENNLPAPPVGVPGQEFILRFCVTGFATDPQTRKPNVSFSVRILDEAGIPTLSKPFTGEAKDLPEEFKDIFPVSIPIRPNRPGRFRIEASVTDNLTRTKTTIKQETPFLVLEPK